MRARSKPLEGLEILSGIFRPKPVRRTQRRSGGLVDGLEGRTPDVEAPAELTTAALDGDVREPEEPFSVYRSGQAGEA
jgi:hypothetical protein